MSIQKILEEVRENFQSVINQDSPFAKSLWQAFLELHPADIADFIESLEKEEAQAVFTHLPHELVLQVFQELSEPMKARCLAFMDDRERVAAMRILTADELTDLFDQLSDEELKNYLNLLHVKEREKVLALLKFDPESAGGIMATDVITLMEDYTVEQSIKLLQRLRPSRDVHEQMFVVDKDHRLVGHINLEDLVLEKPQTRLSSFMHKNELVARANQDQEEIAKKMVHYGLMIVPVVDDENLFLGVIPSETLVDVIVEEASEDVQRMASMPPMKYPYFDMSFGQLFFQRGYVLVALLIAELFNGNILRSYEATITGILLGFIPMLTSAGGNTGSQTSAVVIQGMASGDITFSNMIKFLRREFLMSLTLSAVMGLIVFGRTMWMGGSFPEAMVVSFSLGLIVLISAMLGSVIPFILRRFNVDPAFASGPFLATVMDILGVVIFCSIAQFILT